MSEQRPLHAILAEAASAEQAGALDAASTLLQSLGPALHGDAAALTLAGIVAARLGDLAGARAHLQCALAAPTLPPHETGPIHRNLTEICRRLGLFAEAVESGRRAAALLPLDATALHNLGLALTETGEYDAALAAFSRATALDPHFAGAHLGRADILLRRGDALEGWREYAWRHRLPGAPTPPQNTAAIRWAGEPHPGTLLLLADQGQADIAAFARFIPFAAARCHRLTMLAPADMLPVLATVPGIAALTADAASPGPFTAWCPLSDLPALAAATDATLPRPPYLAAPPARIATWETRLAELAPRAPGHRRIGLLWAGAPPAGTAGLAGLAPLFTLPDITWISLQTGDATAEIGAYFGPAPLINAGAEINDLADAMAIVTQLDLLVAPCGPVAHLAGAMGAPLLVMLGRHADWRWGEGSESAWYPNARVIRGDLADLAESVSKARGSAPRPR